MLARHPRIPPAWTNITNPQRPQWKERDKEDTNPLRSYVRAVATKVATAYERSLDTLYRHGTNDGFLPAWFDKSSVAVFDSLPQTVLVDSS